MKTKLLLLLCVALVTLGGCAKPVPKDWTPTSGSRADATVKMSYWYDPTSEIPQTNEQQALELAKKRCASWGYSDVEAFGGVMESCTQWVAGFGGPMCIKMVVTKEYQCIGRGDAEVSNNAPAKK